MEDKIINKLIKHLQMLICKGERDQLISGDQFWQLNERGLKLLDPKDVILKIKENGR